MNLRETVSADAPVLAKLRVLQLIDEGSVVDKDIDSACEEYFTAEMQAGRVRGWAYEDEGEIVSVLSVSLLPFPPSFGYPGTTWGYMQSVYTKPDYRGRGLASCLTNKALEVLRAEGCKRFFLYASPEGQPVYEKQGFAVDRHFMAIKE